MLDGWISINEYARKFNVSDITVRRRIKQGRIPAELKNGKYYIRADYRETPPLPNKKAALPPPPPPPPPTTDDRPQVVAEAITTKPATPPNRELVDLYDRYLVELKAKEGQLIKKHSTEIALLETKLSKKDREIISLKQQIEDLQLLVKILENKL